MTTKMLGINDVDATGKPVVYTCFGLGSCIGLFVTDRVKKLSGGAHIPLPSSSGLNQYHNASQMIDELLEAFQKQGSDLKYLRAKVTGGAHVYESSLRVGEQNIHAVLQCLLEKKIFVAGVDVGGHVARTARFNTVTGELEISTSDRKMYTL
jgi:chemotaxis protein CheD